MIFNNFFSPVLGWPKRLFFFIDMYNIGFGMTLSPTCQLFSIAWPKSFHIYTFCILPCLFQLDTAIVKIFYCLKFVFINIFKFNNNAFTYLKCKSHSIFKVVLSGLKSMCSIIMSPLLLLLLSKACPDHNFFCFSR